MYEHIINDAIKRIKDTASFPHKFDVDPNAPEVQWDDDELRRIITQAVEMAASDKVSELEEDAGKLLYAPSSIRELFQRVEQLEKDVLKLYKSD